MFMLDGGATCIYFDKNAHDDYCVYVDSYIRPYHNYTPTDDMCLEWLLTLSKQYGAIQVWDDFMQVYKLADNELRRRKCIDLVQKINMHYNEDTLLLWIILYMTMVSVCLKKNAAFNKRTKALSVYNILFDGYNIKDTITYMRSKNKIELDRLMKERGI